MAISKLQPRFRCPLASLMEQFIQVKRACGYRFDTGVTDLMRFDRYLCDEALATPDLPRAIVRKWLVKRPHESVGTHQARISTARQFAQYLCRLSHHAYVPERSFSPRASGAFSPRILTLIEIQQLLHAVDHFTPSAQSPLRHLVMPEVFRLLYGCGFRLNEVLHLRVADVDLNHGVLTLRDTKSARIVWSRPPLPSCSACKDLPPSSAFDRPMPTSSRRYTAVPGLAERSTRSSVNCCVGAESRMAAAARDRVCMTFATQWLSTPCCGGTAKVPTSTPSCRYSPPTWGINRWPEPNAICI